MGEKVEKFWSKEFEVCVMLFCRAWNSWSGRIDGDGLSVILARLF